MGLTLETKGTRDMIRTIESIAARKAVRTLPAAILLLAVLTAFPPGLQAAGDGSARPIRPATHPGAADETPTSAAAAATAHSSAPGTTSPTGEQPAAIDDSPASADVPSAGEPAASARDGSASRSTGGAVGIIHEARRFVSSHAPELMLLLPRSIRLERNRLVPTVLRAADRLAAGRTLEAARLLLDAPLGVRSEPLRKASGMDESLVCAFLGKALESSATAGTTGAPGAAPATELDRALAVWSRGLDLPDLCGASPAKAAEAICAGGAVLDYLLLAAAPRATAPVEGLELRELMKDADVFSSWLEKNREAERRRWISLVVRKESRARRWPFALLVILMALSPLLSAFLERRRTTAAHGPESGQEPLEQGRPDKRKDEGVGSDVEEREELHAHEEHVEKGPPAEGEGGADVGEEVVDEGDSSSDDAEPDVRREGAEEKGPVSGEASACGEESSEENGDAHGEPLKKEERRG